MAELTVVTPPAATALARLVEDYLTSCRARGLSPKTINHAYAYPLRFVFLPWCARQGIDEAQQLTKRALDRFNAELLEQGGKKGPLSRWSVKTYLRVVDQFLNWAKAEGEGINVNLQMPKTPRRLLDVLSRDEIQALEDVAPNERDKLIVRVLADTGIRVGELIGLRLSDLIPQDRNHYLRVRGKGDKERLVPIPRLFRRLQKYAVRGRSRDTDSDRLFIGLRRRPGGDYEPLTASGVEQMIRNLGQIANIPKRVYPHLLRHSFATWAITRGVDPITLARILGHSSLAMIQQHYSHLKPSDMHQALLQALTADD